jgi:excisionase family DNA binding protein
MEPSSHTPAHHSRRPKPSDGESRSLELLTITEVASALRVSKMTVYRLIKSGRLPGLRVGNSIRVYRDDLSAFLRGAVESPAGGDSEPADSEPGGTSETGTSPE